MENLFRTDRDAQTGKCFSPSAVPAVNGEVKVFVHKLNKLAGVLNFTFSIQCNSFNRQKMQ